MTEEQDKIVRFDEHSHSFNLPDTDFKAEVVASGLKEAGYDAERTLIFRRGDIRRGFSKDIHDIHPEYSHYDLTDYLYLYVNRRSLYDEHIPQEPLPVRENIEGTGAGRNPHPP